MKAVQGRSPEQQWFWLPFEPMLTDTTPSLPHVPLVVGDSVRVEQLPEFLLKADNAVVPFLSRDVLHDLFHVRRAYVGRESCHSGLSSGTSSSRTAQMVA